MKALFLAAVGLGILGGWFSRSRDGVLAAFGKLVILFALIFAAIASTGCAELPTAPSKPSAVVIDPRYDAAFMASFTTGAPPKSLVVYVPDVDDKGNRVPAETVAQGIEAAASLQRALGLSVDVRPMAGAPAYDVLRGLLVRWMWSDVWTPDGPRIGGYGIAGQAVVNYRASTFEVCGGLAQTVVRHELMHAMGFMHTDDPSELMFPEVRYCDRLPSAREVFHARVALGVE